MQLTDAELHELNKIVYDVKEGRFQPPFVQDIVLDTSSRQMQVVKIKVDPDTGYQAFAVAPIKADGTPDYNQVTAVVAGTSVGIASNPSEIKNLDWRGVLPSPYNVPIISQLQSLYSLLNNSTKSAIAASVSNGSWQISVHDKFIQEMQAENWNIVQLSGHSQGGGVALKIGAKYGIPTKVFNGWFKYNTLTESEKAFMMANPDLFVNYRHGRDWLVFFNDLNMTDNDLGTILWVTHGFGHMLDTWTIRDDGSVSVIGSKEEFYQGRMKQVRSEAAMGLWNLKNIRKILERKGTLSTNQTIYLNYQEALVAIRGSRRIMAQRVQK